MSGGIIGGGNFQVLNLQNHSKYIFNKSIFK